jgi:cytochrome c2
MKRFLFPLLLLLALACNRDEAAKSATPPPAPPTGNAERGKMLAAQYGCNVCHVVPGVEGPQGSLGPSLAGIASRPAISFGAVRNTPENLAKFIQEPASLNPQSSMPPIGLTEPDAKDIAAFLLTLK